MSSRFDHLEFASHSKDSEVKVENQENLLQSYIRRATEAFEQESFGDSLKLYARILEIEPANLFSWIGQIHSLIHLNRTEEALNWATHALEDFPTSEELIALKAIALARSNKPGEALSFSDAAINASQTIALSWLARAEILVMQKDSTADYCETRALDSAPKAWQLPWLVSRMRFYHKNHAVALRWAEMAVDRGPSQATPWLQTGRCQAALGLKAQAKQSIERASELSPQSSAIATLSKELSQESTLTRILRGLGFRSYKP